MTTSEIYAANLALYEKLVATNPNVERKGTTMPYTSLNGHMFSLLTKEGVLALRLPTKEREVFLEKYEPLRAAWQDNEGVRCSTRCITRRYTGSEAVF